MTYRQHFVRRLKLILWPAIGSVFLMIVVAAVQRYLDMPDAPGAAVAFALAVVTFVVAFVLQHTGFRCPGCRKKLGQFFGAGGFRYCPHCAFDLEQEIGTADVAIRRP